jgi:hypothetical protein
VIPVKLGKLGTSNKFEYPRGMTKHECRMTKEAQSPNDEGKFQSFVILLFVILSSFVIRISAFFG